MKFIPFKNYEEEIIHLLWYLDLLLFESVKEATIFIRSRQLACQMGKKYQCQISLGLETPRGELMI